MAVCLDYCNGKSIENLLFSLSKLHLGISGLVKLKNLKVVSLKMFTVLCEYKKAVERHNDIAFLLLHFK